LRAQLDNLKMAYACQVYDYSSPIELTESYRFVAGRVWGSNLQHRPCTKDWTSILYFLYCPLCLHYYETIPCPEKKPNQ